MRNSSVEQAALGEKPYQLFDTQSGEVLLKRLSDHPLAYEQLNEWLKYG